MVLSLSPPWPPPSASPRDCRSLGVRGSELVDMEQRAKLPNSGARKWDSGQHQCNTSEHQGLSNSSSRSNIGARTREATRWWHQGKQHYGGTQFSILKTQRMCLQGRGGGTGPWHWNMQGTSWPHFIQCRSLDTTVGKSESKDVKWGHRPVPLPAAA